MPDRDNASYCRPRLYDANDPEANDDVGLVLRLIDFEMERCMEQQDKETLEHAADLKRRLLKYAGEPYQPKAVETTH